MLFFRFRKADHRYWKLINYALTWARPNLFLSIFMPVARMLQHVVFVYLANTAVLCYSLTIICCWQVQNYIYWIISTENDYRHHHKFMKYEKRLRKEGNMPRFTYQAKYLPLQRKLGRVYVALPSVRSNDPTDLLHISCICSIWKILHFYSSFSLNPSKSAFYHALILSLLPKNQMLFIVSKQCSCSRRVHIEGLVNRVGLNWIIVIMDTHRIFYSITV
jgi:hypothetical protein